MIRASPTHSLTGQKTLLLQFAQRGRICRVNLYRYLPADDGRFSRLCYRTVHGFRTGKTTTGRGFPAAKAGRDNELLGIPTLEELIAAVRAAAQRIQLLRRTI